MGWCHSSWPLFLEGGKLAPCVTMSGLVKDHKSQMSFFASWGSYTQTLASGIYVNNSIYKGDDDSFWSPTSFRVHWSYPIPWLPKLMSWNKVRWLWNWCWVELEPEKGFFRGLAVWCFNMLHVSGQIIATSHDLSLKGSWWREISLFQGACQQAKTYAPLGPERPARRPVIRLSLSKSLV